MYVLSALLRLQHSRARIYVRTADAAKYLFCRLCLRKKDKWHRLSALKYQSELGNGIRDALDILCGHPPAEEEDVKPAVQNMEIVIPEMEPNFRFDAHPQVKPDPDADPSTRTEPAPEAKPEVKKEVKPQVKPEIKQEAKPSSPKSPKYPVIKVEERDVIDLTFDEEDEEAPKAGPSRSPEYEPELPAPSSTPKTPDFSVFADDEEQATPLELLDCLNTDELADIAKQLKIKLRSKKVSALNVPIIQESDEKHPTSETSSLRASYAHLRLKAPLRSQLWGRGRAKTKTWSRAHYPSAPPRARNYSRANCPSSPSTPTRRNKTAYE